VTVVMKVVILQHIMSISYRHRQNVRLGPTELCEQYRWENNCFM